MEKMHRQGMQKGHKAPMSNFCNTLLQSPCIHKSGSSLNLVLWVFIEASLHKHGLNHCLLIQPLSRLHFLEVREVEMNLLIRWLFLQATSPHLQEWSKRNRITVTKDTRRHPYCSHHLGNSEGLRCCEQITLDKDQIYMKNILVI